MLSPLYVVTTVFNPRRFKSRIRLYNNFKKWVEFHGVKLLTVEVAYGDRPFDVTNVNDPWNLQLRTSADLWHKERSLNLGIQRLSQLAPKWEYMAYMDCDIKLMNDDWATELPHLHQHYAILQVFGFINTLGPNHHTLYGGRSIARQYHSAGKFTKPPAADASNYTGFNGWPGLGWSFRRPELEAVGGLLDTCVTGSGDTHMAGCYLGNSKHGMPAQASPGFKRAVDRYGELCEQHIKQNVSYLPGLLIHYWHGEAKNRGYDKRRDSILRHQFDPHEDLVTDMQGLYKWKGNKIELEREIRRSMEERNEDSVDLFNHSEQ